MRKIPSLMLGSVVLTLLAAVLVSCGTAATPTPTATPTPVSNYPATVNDILGRQLRLDAAPARIITAHPTATEMLYRIGGVAVGRDTSSRYPPEVQSVATIGSAYSLSMEAVAALKPDLLILEGLTQARFLEPLQNIGLPVIVVRAASLDDITKSLNILGQALDRKKEAALAVAEIQTRIAASKGTVPSPRKILILISDAERNIYAAKPESYPGAVAALLGLTNLVEGLPESGPYPGFSSFSPEQALAASPDVVFAISPAPPPAPRLSAMLPAVPGFSAMAAVKAGRVKEIDPVLFLQAQGPRIADAIDEMARLVNEAAP